MARKTVPLPTPSGAPAPSILLDLPLMEGFVRTFLHAKFDSPKATPSFHKELWNLCCDPYPYVAIAAPRGHAKSTSVTLSFTLASLCFGARDNILIISASEKLAIDHLKELKLQLTENEMLIEAFNIHGFAKENETEFICHIGDRIIRVIAKGAGQKIRGAKWRGKRPNLVIIDDLEDEEEVLNPASREKLSNWFTSTLLPIGSDDCIFRVLGTILHSDSLLSTLLSDPSWHSACYRAHASFDDFSQILWPEKFPEPRLRLLRQLFINKHNPSGYSREYLNFPLADTDRYFRPELFLPLEEHHRSLPMRFYSGIDFAISQSEHADRTAIVTCGMLPTGHLVIIDVRAGRWDSLTIIQEMFAVHNTFHPELFICEDGAIRKSIGPFLNMEMIRTGTFLNIVKRIPTKDKTSRARSIQARFLAGSILIDKLAPWYDDFFNELTTFPRGDHDDRVDALAWIGLELESLQSSPDLEEIEESDYASLELESLFNQGRCIDTGY